MNSGPAATPHVSAARVSFACLSSRVWTEPGLFAEIVLATTDEMSGLVAALAENLAESHAVREDLRELAHRLRAALMQPRLVQLRRLIIANADHFPELGRT